MTTASDWPHGVDPMPSIEPSSDLFDGDILGDELIDIYNAAVVGGSDESIDEIPTLLSLVPNPPVEKKQTTNPRVSLHPGEPGDDDGLGAFRPSTSFNDLTTFLPPGTSGDNAKSLITPVVSSAAISVKGADAKKRSNAQSGAEGPAAKRRASSSRKNAATIKPKSKAVPSNKSTKGPLIGKQGTPNPLTTGGQPAVAAPSGNKVHLIKAMAKPSTMASAVPQSRLIAKTEPMDNLASTPTEADFKSVAQAAVSNLIASAGNKPENPNKPATVAKEDSIEIVDTSTEHIKALTGSNWVTVCSDGQSCSSGGDKTNNRARRQNLTPDERARQNRDRNREHARNTRLRKKAYVDELKRTLTALVSQRDSAELEKRHSAQRELEQREVRFRVVEEFLKLRGRNEGNYARWSAILEDSFIMTLPNTDYREIAAERGQYEQSLSGVAQAMADSSMFAGFLQSLAKVSSGHQISFVYNCDRNHFFMDNCTAVLYWTATSNGAIHQGAPAELTVRGNVTAKFSPASNKLVSVALSFDTGIVLSQINHVFKYAAYTDVDEADNAAQVAASNADAILDSLQMPHIATSAPNKVCVLPAISAASVTDGEKSDSSDESNGDV